MSGSLPAKHSFGLLILCRTALGYLPAWLRECRVTVSPPPSPGVTQYDTARVTDHLWVCQPAVCQWTQLCTRCVTSPGVRSRQPPVSEASLEPTQCF